MTQYTAFDGDKRVTTGDMAQMIAAQRAALPRGVNLLIFDDATGQVRDVDLREAPPPARGRPKLGVKAREVTLLPRHWDWLNAGRGGASATLRRLVEAAMKDSDPSADPKVAMDRTYAFLQAIAGDFPGYEDALRKLFAADWAGFHQAIAGWPDDVRAYANTLLGQPQS